MVLRALEYCLTYEITMGTPENRRARKAIPIHFQETQRKPGDIFECPEYQGKHLLAWGMATEFLFSFDWSPDFDATIISTITEDGRRYLIEILEANKEWLSLTEGLPLLKLLKSTQEAQSDSCNGS